MKLEVGKRYVFALISLWLWSWHPTLAVLFVLLIVCSDGEFMDMPSHV